MLVLTRKQGERIQIGDDVTITVVRTKGKSVRLGIQAPPHVPVLRGEIARALAAQTDAPASPMAGKAAAEECIDDVERSEDHGPTLLAARGPLHALVEARSV